MTQIRGNGLIMQIVSHVNWEFLLYLVGKKGLWGEMESMDSLCISMVRFSILIKGAPSGFFSSTRGLRQRNSLSPLFL